MYTMFGRIHDEALMQCFFLRDIDVDDACIDDRIVCSALAKEFK